MDGKAIAKSTQEQAAAAWIGYLNQLRLDQLLGFIQQQDKNLSEAMDEMHDAMQEIGKTIAVNRGGEKGIHGFLAEIAENGVGNAKENILGKADIYEHLNDNSPVDLVRDGVDIQMKFRNSGLSLGAISEHLQKYPDFLKNGGKFLIPKDQYDKIKYLLSVSEKQANKLSSSDGTFSKQQWKAVHNFFETGEVDFDSIEPAALDYKDVQKGQIDATMQRERKELLETDKKRRHDEKTENRGTMREGAKATAVAGGLEGGTTFLLAIAEKKKAGKTIKDFDSDDWVDIFQKAGLGSVKGSARGFLTYVLTNAYTNSSELTTVRDVNFAKAANRTNTTTASAMVTAGFGVAEQAYRYRKGSITEQEFLENSVMLSAETTVSALSTLIGQIVIPVPVLGAIIGNTIGMTLYKIAVDGLNEKEQRLIQEYVAEIQEYNNTLEEQYRMLVESVCREYKQFLEIVEALYSVDVKEAFESSVRLAIYCGVPQEEILDTKEKVDSYFLG